MNATKCEEDITTDYRQTNLIISHNNTNDNTSSTYKSSTAKSSSTLGSRKWTTNTTSDNNGTNSFLTSLYTRCIRNPNRRKKKHLDNTKNNNNNFKHHYHQSHFCLNFCRYCLPNTPSSTSASSSSSSSTAATSITAAPTVTGMTTTPRRKESNSFTLQFPLDNKHYESVMSSSSNNNNNNNLNIKTDDISSYKSKNTFISNYKKASTISVPDSSNQSKSISVCMNSNDTNNNNQNNNNEIDTHNTFVHRNKHQATDASLPHNPVNSTEFQKKANIMTPVMTTSIPTITTTTTNTTNTTITKTTNIHKKTNPSVIITDNSAYFNENLLELSKLPMYNSTSLCDICQKNIQLISQDNDRILLLTNSQEKTIPIINTINSKDKNDTTTTTTTTTTTNNNDNNVNMNTHQTDDIKSKQIKEIESDIEEYAKHVQHIFNHINMTRDQFCQTNTTTDNQQLWHAFNTADSSQAKIFRPTHHDINFYHLDDDDDDLNNNTNNNGDENDNDEEDNDDEEELIETHYDNVVHSCRKLMNFPNDDKMDAKRITKIYRELHNLRCQVESFSYLSWLGLTTEQPPTQNILVPGLNAPAPNPQMHLIRRSDADSRRNIQEFQRLCKEPVSKEDLIELRSSTFNNWSRTDAQLIRLVREIFQELGFIEHYNLQLHRLDLWLTDIYRRYNRIPFHNYKHAFMVTQMCYVLIWSGNLNNLLDIEDQMILIVSAICHDLDHPGFNNAYQVRAKLLPEVKPVIVQPALEQLAYYTDMQTNEEKKTNIDNHKSDNDKQHSGNHHNNDDDNSNSDKHNIPSKT
ncbi:unnamed protein product [Schistosoma turkestanicum]|nr:unnamed protein product [Schistosoma turkestanicum]